MNLWLLDTGPVVAYFDARDPQHEQVATALESFSGKLVTTSAVIVEAMHFPGRVPSSALILVDFLLASGTEIHEIASLEGLTDAAELMAKYADIPMDFADATLVLLGDQLNAYSICTLDRRGFRSYRTRSGKAFELVLDGE
ncbi:MAG: PIN domain-containing protein [Planctomycetota bacterium]|nr:PIN domain-containing protein [Planctomycetota bacterium]